MKLSVQTTREISTDELRIFCNPPLTFEVRGFISPSLSKALDTWEETNYNSEKAIEFVNQIFVSVSQNGESYPLTTREDVLALRDAIGNGNTEQGNDFLAKMIMGYTLDHWRFFQQKLLASESSSQVSAIGSKNGVTT